MLRTMLGLGVFVALTTSWIPAMAEEVVINQKGKKFSERKIEIHVGDSVRFVNDDSAVHNVHSTTAGQAFDLGAQKTGTEVVHVFSKPGKAKVRCAIHPKMKMTVVVE